MPKILSTWFVHAPSYVNNKVQCCLGIFVSLQPTPFPKSKPRRLLRVWHSEHFFVKSCCKCKRILQFQKVQIRSHFSTEFAESFFWSEKKESYCLLWNVMLWASNRVIEFKPNCRDPKANFNQRDFKLWGQIYGQTPSVSTYSEFLLSNRK